MVRTKGPLLSLDAKGTLAKMLVHSSCRSTKYTKKHVIPHDPKSPKQMAGRALMRWLTRKWATMLPNQRATWIDLGNEDNLPPYQAFLRHNAKRWAHFKSPTIKYPATETRGNWAFDALSVWGKVKCIAVDVYTYAEDSEIAIGIHRSAEGAIPTPGDLVAIISAPGDDGIHWEDNNVAVGVEWYYRPVILNTTGYLEVINAFASGIALP